MEAILRSSAEMFFVRAIQVKGHGRSQFVLM